MKIDIRWQLLLAVICLSLVLSLVSYQVQSEGECTTRVPSTGGRLGVGVVGRPDKINPLLAAENPVDQELVNLIFDGLVRYDSEGLPQPALAESWSISEDGKGVTITLKDDIRWHDGHPFSADDVLFTYGLLQEETFPAPQPLKDLWSAVTISSTDSLAVELILPQPYGPIVDALSIGILPAHLLERVSPSQLADNAFNSSPVGTGPFAASQVYSWRQSGNLRLIPNPEYWDREVQIDTLDYHFYPDFAALTDAYDQGLIQAISGIEASDIPELLNLPDIQIYTNPGKLLTMLLFNMEANASLALQSAQGRRALALAVDREYLIDRANNGQGLLFDGPYGLYSWAYQGENQPSISFDSTASTALLDELGWLQVEGSGVRERDGAVLELRLLAGDDQLSRTIANVLREQWAEQGIAITPRFVPHLQLQQALSERDFDVAVAQVMPNNDPDLYDFWSQEAIVEGRNYGAWNNRAASEALELGRQRYAVEERLPHYESFVQIYNEELPAFSLFESVDTFAISDTVHRAAVGLFHEPRERYGTLADWFLLFREVAVPCPDEDLEGAS